MKSLILDRHSNLVRRMGAATFLFFLIKGLLWLAAPLVFVLFA